MRTLQQAADDGHMGAALAIDVFCYQLAKSILALGAGLARLDALVFTGGIGEHSATIRARTVEHLSLLGIQLDREQNTQHGREAKGVISSVESAVCVLTIATNEEWQIAVDTTDILSAAAAGASSSRR